MANFITQDMIVDIIQSTDSFGEIKQRIEEIPHDKEDLLLAAYKLNRDRDLAFEQVKIQKNLRKQQNVELNARYSKEFMLRKKIEKELESMKKNERSKILAANHGV